MFLNRCVNKKDKYWDNGITRHQDSFWILAMFPILNYDNDVVYSYSSNSNICKIYFSNNIWILFFDSLTHTKKYTLGLW